jgi:MFS family permease
MKQGKFSWVEYGRGLKAILFNRNYLLLILISICNNFALTMAKAPMTPYGMSLGIAPAVIGAMTGTYYLVCLITRPFTGIAIDKINKKLMMCIALGIKAAGFVVMAFAQGYSGFFAGRMIDAVSFSLITTIFMSTTSLIVDRRAMGTAVGLFSGIPTLVVSAVPSLAMAIFNKSGGRNVFLYSAVALVIGIVLVFFLQFPKTEKTAEKKSFSINDVVYLPAVIPCLPNFFLSLLLTVCDVNLVALATERGFAGAEIYISVKALVNVAAGVGLGALSDLLSSRKILIGAYIATIVASIMFGSATNLTMVIVAAVIYFIFQRGTVPVLIKAASEVAPPELRGAAISTNYLIQDLAGVFGGYIVAFVTGSSGLAGAFYVIAVFPAVGLIIYLINSRKTTNVEEKA